MNVNASARPSGCSWRTERCADPRLGPLRFRWDVPAQFLPDPGTTARLDAALGDPIFQPARKLQHVAGQGTLSIQFAAPGLDYDTADLGTIALEQAGQRITHLHRLGDDEVEFLSEPTEQSPFVACHSRVVRDVTRFARIDALVTETTPSAVRQAMVAAMHSFRWLHPGAPLETAGRIAGTAGDRGELRFEFPAGWTLQRGQDASRVLLCHPKSARILGEIEVAVAAADGLEAACRTRARAMEHSGLVLSGAPMVSITPPRGFAAAALHSPSARFARRPVACGTIALQGPGCIVTVGVRGIGRQENALVWAAVRRATMVVVETMSVLVMKPPG